MFDEMLLPTVQCLLRQRMRVPRYVGRAGVWMSLYHDVYVSCANILAITETIHISSLHHTGYDQSTGLKEGVNHIAGAPATTLDDDAALKERQIMERA